MIRDRFTRREAITRAGLLLGAGLAGAPAIGVAAAAGRSQGPAESRFLFSLNTATIRGQKLGLAKEVEIAARAGYGAIEPWVDSIEAYRRGGGSLKEMRRRLSDLGLVVPSAIAFPEWIVDDAGRRAKGMEQAKRDMELVSQLGGKRMAAPPAGATGAPKLTLTKAADRYRSLLEAGERIGVVPELELWGFSKNLGRLGECACVAIETGQGEACVLLDVFHLYKGGTNYHSLRLLSASAAPVLHMNDYPASPPREKINDSFRVYPGDGIAPLVPMLKILRATGGQRVLSLELFNREYWRQDPLKVAQTGLAKMKALARRAESGSVTA